MTKEEFKNKRIELGLTQLQLSEILGVSSQQISNIETGTNNAGKTLLVFFNKINKKDVDNYKSLI